MSLRLPHQNIGQQALLYAITTYVYKRHNDLNPSSVLIINMLYQVITFIPTEKFGLPPISYCHGTLKVISLLYGTPHHQVCLNNTLCVTLTLTPNPPPPPYVYICDIMFCSILPQGRQSAYINTLIDRISPTNR